MAQKLWLGALGGTGIVAVLFIIGFVLYASGVEKGLGWVALSFAVFLAIIFGLLGIIGILKRLMR
jgi:hypothetical protein